MKKIRSVFLVLLMVFALFGCGKGGSPKEVDRTIQEISDALKADLEEKGLLEENGIESYRAESAMLLKLDPQITAAMEAYNSLSDKGKTQVTKYSLLRNWNTRLIDLKRLSDLTGTWIDPDDGTTFTLYETGNYDLYGQDSRNGWGVNPTGTTVNIGDSDYQVVQDGGITQLKSPANGRILVREADYEGQFKNMKAFAKETVPGNWIDLMGYIRNKGHEDHYTFSADGRGSFNGDTPFSWGVEPGQVCLYSWKNYDILQDDGIPLLRQMIGELLVKETDFDAYFSKYFVAVDITPENIRDYIGEPVVIGGMVDQWGEPLDVTILSPERAAYEKGLVLLGWSDDFKYEITEYGPFGANNRTYDEPFPLLNNYGGSTTYSMGERAMGSLLFVRAEYVAKNTLEGSKRTVKLTNGIEFSSYVYAGDQITTNYENYKY